MGIHTGPKDGDYARYVEVLTGGTSGTPGKVYASRSEAPAGWTVESEMPPLPDGFKPDPVAINPIVTPGAGPLNNVPNPDAAGTAPQGTLAARSAKRTTAFFFSLVAIVMAVIAVNMLAGAAQTGRAGFEGFIPGGFLLVFALMLFKSARGLRRDAEAPATALPPFTLSTMKDKK